MTPIDRFLAALDARGHAARKSGGGWTAKCPAHEDRQPSLSFTSTADGKVVMRCHAGCTPEAIVAALGMEMTDLFPEGGTERAPRAAPRAAPEPARAPRSAPAPSLPYEDEIRAYHADLLGNEKLLGRLEDLRGWTRAAIERLGLGFDGERIVFPVRDAEGKLVGVVRYAPNPARRGDAPKSKADPGSAREMFPAPETLSGPLALVFEGEPDGVSATSIDLPATSIAGANGWRSVWAARFGRFETVALVFDCDRQGREAAAKVASDLAAVVKDVRVIDLEPTRDDGYDFGDIVRKVRGAEQRGQARAWLLSLISRAEKSEPEGAVVVSFAEVRRQRVRWLVPGRVPLGMLTLLVGDMGDGKSLLTCLWAAQLSRGNLGEQKSPAATLMVNAEDSWGATMKPRLEAAGADLSLVHAIKMRRQGMDVGVTIPDDIVAIEDAVTKHGVRLVVIDPLNAALPERVNSWSDQSVRGALAPLYRLAERQGCTILVVAHVNKAVGMKPLHRIGGSVGIPAAARSAVLFARDPKDPDGPRRLLAHAKCNVGPRLTSSLVYEVEQIVIPGNGEPEAKTARLREAGRMEATAEQLLAGAVPEEEAA